MEKKTQSDIALNISTSQGEVKLISSLYQRDKAIGGSCTHQHFHLLELKNKEKILSIVRRNLMYDPDKKIKSEFRRFKDYVIVETKFAIRTNTIIAVLNTMRTDILT